MKVIMLLFFWILLLVIGYFVSTYTCNSRWELSNKETTFKLFAGCLVKDEAGNFVPEGNYRTIN